MEEKEIKIRIGNEEDYEKIKQYIEKKQNISFQKGKEVEDIYFDTESSLFFKSNHAFRIRNCGRKSEIAYKAFFNIPQRKENPWFIFEKEFSFPLKKENFLELLSLLKFSFNEKLPLTMNTLEAEKALQDIGLNKNIIISKKRFIAKKENLTFMLDIIDGLGIFLEIETSQNDNLKILIEKFNIPYKIITMGYTNLYAKNILNLDIPDFDKKYIENPDWNFFDGQKEIVQNIIRDK